MEENQGRPLGPNSEKEEKPRRTINRRELIGGAIASAACYLLSPCAIEYAFAYPEWQFADEGTCAAETHKLFNRYRGEVEFDNNDDPLKYDSHAQARTAMFAWPFSTWSKIGTGYLGAGVAADVYCGYVTALFAYIDYKPLVLAYSNSRWAWGYPYRDDVYEWYYQGWHNIGEQDNSYKLYFRIDGSDVGKQPVADVTCDLNLQKPPDGASYSTSGEESDSALQLRYTNDYIQWHSSDSTWDSLTSGVYKLRRGTVSRMCDFRVKGEYWNFYCNQGDCNGVTHGRSDSIILEQEDSDNNWLCQKVPSIEMGKSGGDFNDPHCGIEWAGRIVMICDGGDDRKSLITGNGTEPAGSKYTIQLWKAGDDWPDASSRLNRNWYIGLNTRGTTNPAAWSVDADKKQLGTMSIVNVMQLNHGAPRNLDQNRENIPLKVYKTPALIYSTSGSANQAFWIHTATVGGKTFQFIVSDDTGLMLEHADWQSSDICICSFHTNGQGLAKDLYYGNHQWKLQDVVFRHRKDGGAINIGADEQPVGNTLSMGNIEGETYPFVDGNGGAKLRYEIRWVELPDGQTPDYLSDNVYIAAQANYETYGIVNATKPANNMVGALNLKALKALKLWLAGSSRYSSGSGIAYRFRQYKKYGDGDRRWSEGWEDWQADGGATGPWGSDDFRAVCFQAHLYGPISKYYTLRYRAGNSLGWCKGWRDEGSILIAPQEDTPGHTIANAYIQSLAIEVVPRAEVLKEIPYSSSRVHPGNIGEVGSDTTPSPWLSSGTGFKLEAKHHGKRFAGVARAVIPSKDYDEPSYLGFVRTKAVKCQSYCDIHFIADGCDELDTVYRHPVGTPYYFTSENVTNCTRSNVERLDYWYTDSGYKTKVTGSFTPNDYTKKDYYIYCRNVCKLTFQFADDTLSFFDANAPYKDKSFASSLARSSMMPSDCEVYYNTKLYKEWVEKIWRGKNTTAYVKGLVDGRAVQTDAIQSVFGARSANKSTQPLAMPIMIQESRTLYIVWTRATFDGFDSN